MSRIASTALFAAMLCAAAFAAQPPRILGDEGATFDDLIREQRLVTITLSSGAQDKNVKITGFYPERGTLGVESLGRPTAYRFENIAEVRVQKGYIQNAEKPNPETVLTAEDRKIVDDAANRAMAIFTDSHIQPLKMAAANIIAASNHDKKNDSISYLKDLSKSNDAQTVMLAALFLWTNGETVPGDLILSGLNSGNRGARSGAAELVGLTKSNQFVMDLRKLFEDPTIEITTAAAISLGRINDMQSVPKLIQSLASITEQKAEAGIRALSFYKDPEVKRQLEQALDKAQGLQRFRIVRALHLLGDERARALLATEFMREPAFDEPSALILAKDGDPDALKYLRDYRQKPWDPNEENLIFRAELGLALYSSGDIQSKNIVADVLNTQPNDIYAPGKTQDQKFKEETVRKVQTKVAVLIGKSMRRDMLPVLAGAIQNSDPGVALSACQAAMQIGNREFGARLNEVLDN